MNNLQIQQGTRNTKIGNRTRTKRGSRARTVRRQKTRILKKGAAKTEQSIPGRRKARENVRATRPTRVRIRIEDRPSNGEIRAQVIKTTGTNERRSRKRATNEIPRQNAPKEKAKKERIRNEKKSENEKITIANQAITKNTRNTKDRVHDHLRGGDFEESSAIFCFFSSISRRICTTQEYAISSTFFFNKAYFFVF